MEQNHKIWLVRRLTSPISRYSVVKSLVIWKSPFFSENQVDSKLLLMDFRIESGSGGDSEVQRTMLELLNQLDGFESTKNIKVIMATNRIDILDSALLRPGRIDRKIEFPPPNEEARLDILKIHSRKMNLTRGINLRKIAEMMPGSSGAEVRACLRLDPQSNPKKKFCSVRFFLSESQITF